MLRNSYCTKGPYSLRVSLCFLFIIAFGFTQSTHAMGKRRHSGELIVHDQQQFKRHQNLSGSSSRSSPVGDIESEHAGIRTEFTQEELRNNPNSEAELRYALAPLCKLLGLSVGL